MHEGDLRTDAAIVKVILNGDREAYSTLVHRDQSKILAAMWRVTGDRAESEELSQAVCCRAYFALASFDPQYRFSTWPYRIAHNLSVNDRGRRLLAERLSGFDPRAEQDDR